MVRFYCFMVQPLVGWFVTETLSDLTEKTNRSQVQETLSRTEKTRLMRAFYRFQLCCNVYELETGEFISFNRWISISESIMNE